MLYGPLFAAVISALRIALFSAFDATRPPDIWRPGEHSVNSTSSWFEALSFDALSFSVPEWLVLQLAVIPPPSVTVIQVAIHPSMAHSSLGHTFHLGSLFQAFHCAYEAPQFVSAHPSPCVAVLKPTPLSTIIYVPPTPVIPTTERFFLPSVTWLTGIHWRVWTMAVNILLRVTPRSEVVVFVAIEFLAGTMCLSIWYYTYWVVSIMLNHSRR